MLKNANIFPGEGFADPHAIVENGRVYIFSGRDASYKIEDFCRMNKWTIISSDDLIHWRKEGDILPTDTYIGDQQNCWAGHVKKKADNFYWYFSNRNFNTGVMVSKSVTGPFKDALGKPLLEGGIAPTPSYDPCVYEENGKYTIFFGAGIYYCCDLNEDMISLASEPQKIEVFDKDNKPFRMDDKSTVFKRNGIYYLCCGNKYSMSKNLKGPYTYMGDFIGAGHNDYFEFKGKSYLSFEFHDTNIYYRGIGVIELEFNDDGTIKYPSDNPTVFYPQRSWNFEKENTFHYFLTNGEDIKSENGGLNYKLDSHIGLRSPVFPGIRMDKDYKVTFTIENINADGLLKILIDKVNVKLGFAKCSDIYTRATIIPIKEGVADYEVVIENSDYAHLRCIKLFGAGPEDTGTVKVKAISVKPL